MSEKDQILEKARPDTKDSEEEEARLGRRPWFGRIRALLRIRAPAVPPSDEAQAPSPPRATRFRDGVLSRRFIPVYIALAVNALFAGAYFWSAGGATAHIRIRAVDGIYTVFVDGKQRVEARCDEYQGGSVIITLPVQDPAAALPHPRGMDRLLVTEAQSGEVLLNEGSSALAARDWTVTGDGRYVLTVGDSSWKNYVVDAYLKNPTQAGIMVDSINMLNGISYSLRPYRHLDNGLDYLKNGKSYKCPLGTALGMENFKSAVIGAVGTVSAPGLEMSKTETLKSMVAMVLRPFPIIVVVALALLLVVAALQLAGLEARLRRLRLPSPAEFPGGLVLVVAAAAFGVLLYISRDVSAGMPHVPDELSYVFQAKILASFHFTTPVPPGKEAFNFFYPSFLFDSGGRWASIYPFGHPLVLAIGQLIGAIWLVPPVLGAVSILLIYRVGKHIHGAQVGIVAALLLAFSPFFQMTASNLMSHNTAAFYLLACLFLITVNWKSKWLAYGLAGIFFGLLLNTRPLTAAALVPPFALLFLSDLVVERGHRIAVIKRSFAFAAGVMLMVGAMYLYNLATTGSLSSGYGSNAFLETVIGFGEKNSVARGMENEQTQLSAFLPVLNGWPLFVGLALVLLPFMLGSRSRWDFFLLLAAISAIGVWTAYESSGLMHGPRYWYEATPLLMLLSARGLTLLQERLAHWVRLIDRRAGVMEEPIALARVSCYGLLAGLLAVSVHGWVLGKHFDIAWNDFMPRTISELKGFNGVDDRLVAKVHDMGIHNALVLVESCPNWQCFGSVFWKNDPLFNGDIVYARDLPEMRSPEMMALYHGRSIYIADYAKDTVVPYEPFPRITSLPGS